LPDHPVQQHAQQAHEEAAEAEPNELPTATDGCGVVTFALPLERMAHAYARFDSLPHARTITDAMRMHPELVGGPDGVDFELMRSARGWFAKGGAEGLLCASDGDSRPLGPALAAFLAPLGVALSRLESRPVKNSRGEIVGELRVTTS
jgi:L-asparaginase II